MRHSWQKYFARKLSNMTWSATMGTLQQSATSLPARTLVFADDVSRGKSVFCCAAGGAFRYGSIWRRGQFPAHDDTRCPDFEYRPPFGQFWPSGGQ